MCSFIDTTEAAGFFKLVICIDVDLVNRSCQILCLANLTASSFSFSDNSPIISLASSSLTGEFPIKQKNLNMVSQTVHVQAVLPVRINPSLRRDYIPICFATSSAKFSCFFSMPSPVS